MKPAYSAALPAPTNDADCRYGIAGWTCRGTGFLWRKDEAAGKSGKYPCPRCNTGQFLAKAKMIAEARHPPLSDCACCSPAEPSGTAVWLAAVETAMAANADATRPALAKLKRVKVFGDSGAVETFAYPAPQSAEA